MKQKYQLALAHTYVQIKEELTQQYRDELNRLAVQTLAASNATTNQLLVQLLDVVKAEQDKHLRRIAVALKHTANIRHLGPDDRVLIAAVENCQGRSTNVGLRGEPTNLIVIQAVKKDVDALRQGDIDARAFRGRTAVVQYQQPPLAVRSADPSQ
ncbi:MAG: hypothetical protein JW741_12620 [Sedimentisphaerales bacterium]|nr:hypothetical protein [Sedimentisphaerales bacterium]